MLSTVVREGRGLIEAFTKVRQQAHLFVIVLRSKRSIARFEALFLTLSRRSKTEKASNNNQVENFGSWYISSKRVWNADFLASKHKLLKRMHNKHRISNAHWRLLEPCEGAGRQKFDSIENVRSKTALYCTAQQTSKSMNFVQKAVLSSHLRQPASCRKY